MSASGGKADLPNGFNKPENRKSEKIVSLGSCGSASRVKRCNDKTLSRTFAVTLLYPGIGAGVTDKLWGIGDMVKVLEDWEKRR
jgi:hypothetical protein